MLRRGCIFAFSMLLFLCSSIAAFAAEDTGEETGGATPSGIPLTGLEAFVDDYVKKYIGQQTVGASVVIVKDGQ